MSPLLAYLTSFCIFIGLSYGLIRAGMHFNDSNRCPPYHLEDYSWFLFLGILQVGVITLLLSVVFGVTVFFGAVIMNVTR